VKCTDSNCSKKSHRHKLCITHYLESSFYTPPILNNKPIRKNNKTNLNLKELGRLEYARQYRALYYQHKKERVKAYSKRDRRKNRQRHNAYARKRQIMKLNRVPVWADLNAIVTFYANCPPGMEVDHIIPLQGKNVSGLHILENLQYLTPEANRKKSNKLILTSSI
jgi:5-methylcytosine-specific restriction endonuclease McrA